MNARLRWRSVAPRPWAVKATWVAWTALLVGSTALGAQPDSPLAPVLAAATSARPAGPAISAHPTPSAHPAPSAASATRVNAGLLDFSTAELQRIQSHGPWPPPAARDAGNAQAGQGAAIALGQRLFFAPRLSASGRMACASCHIPARAFTDGLPRSRGSDGPPLDRNAPSLWNAVHERWYGWDGAADSLWAQALRALQDGREMAASPGHIAAAIAALPELACRYQAAFGRPASASIHTATTAAGSACVNASVIASAIASADSDATLVNAAKAIAAFVGSLQSAPSAFDHFRDALARRDARAAARYPLAAQRGLRLFIGRGQCSTCHSGALFSNGEFADIGAPFFIRPGVVDPGRAGGIAAVQASPYNLLGRHSDAAADDPALLKTRHVRAQPRNFGEFKVPSLRNVAHTAPYLHDGQLATLDAVLQHYSTLKLERLHADGERILQPLNLSVEERADLRAFLHSLSDARATRWRPPALPPCGA